MDCKEVIKMIPDFLNHKLNSRELRNFLNHIEECKELSIQFLVQEGMARLEEGNTFDLQKEFDWMMEDARRRMKIREVFHFLVYAIEILAIITIVTIIVLIIVL